MESRIVVGLVANLVAYLMVDLMELELPLYAVLPLMARPLLFVLLPLEWSFLLCYCLPLWKHLILHQ
eukprot:13344585-Ditylum_brightwellii.AAC.1